MHNQIYDDDEEAHYTEGEKNFGGARKFTSFRCGWEKHKCNGVKNCKFQTKEHGTSVNSQVIIYEKFSELKEANNQRHSRNKNGDGKNHVMDGEVVKSDCVFSSWDNVEIEESNHDGWAFKQQGIVENNEKVNRMKKEITFDMKNNIHNIFNQMSSEKDGSNTEQCRKNKIW